MLIQYHPIGALQETNPVTCTVKRRVHGNVLYENPHLNQQTCPFLLIVVKKRTHRSMTSTQSCNVPDQSMCLEVKV